MLTSANNRSLVSCTSLFAKVGVAMQDCVQKTYTVPTECFDHHSKTKQEVCVAMVMTKVHGNVANHQAI